MLVSAESSGDPSAVSSKGAVGLTQVLPSTAKGMGYSEESLQDPSMQLRIGAEYLKEQQDRFGGDYVKSLSAYNAGPTKTAQWIREGWDGRPETIPYKETREYVQRIGKGYYDRTGRSLFPTAGIGDAELEPEELATETPPDAWTPQPEARQPQPEARQGKYAGYRRLTLPDGRVARVEPGISFNEAWESLKLSHPKSFSSLGPGSENTSSFVDMFRSSLHKTIGQMGITPDLFGSVVAGQLAERDGQVDPAAEDSYDENVKKMILLAAESHAMAPNQVLWDDVVEEYDKEGLYPALVKYLWEMTPQQLGSMGGFLAPALAASAVGVGTGLLAGAALPTLLTASVLGTGAYGATRFLNYMGTNMERAAGEGADDTADVDIRKLLGASGAQTALEIISNKVLTGFPYFRPGGKAPDKDSVISGLGSMLDDVGEKVGLKKLVASASTELTVEIAQQGFERWAANLPVSPAEESAMAEYIETAAMVAGPTLAVSGAAGGFSKLANRKKLEKLERFAQDEQESLVVINQTLDKYAKDFKAANIENAGRENAVKRQENADKRAELELEIQRSRLSEDVELRSRAEEELAALQEEAIGINIRRSVEEQRIIAGDNVSHEDIRNVADARNILWDDDSAFIAFTMRQLGKPKLDMLDASDRVELYKAISDIPKQPFPTKLAAATYDKALEIALNASSGKEITDSDIRKVVGIPEGDVTDSVMEEIVDAYKRKLIESKLVRRVDKGKDEGALRPLVSIDKDGNPKLPIVGDKKSGKAQMTKENYRHFLDYMSKNGAPPIWSLPKLGSTLRDIEGGFDSQSPPRFPEDRALFSDIGVRHFTQAKNLMAYAMLRGDVVPGSAPYSYTPTFTIFQYGIPGSGGPSTVSARAPREFVDPSRAGTPLLPVGR